MKLTEIRKKFLEYFESKKHRVIDSSDLVPHGDDSLLFTNAGMVQFKDTFLGLEKREYSAVSSQKCLRVGGKHNDLENVGFTTRHQTFFEMLGNFSFGGYFKEDAIDFAWEFLTEELKLQKERLWITVHHTDKDSEKIWLEKIGIDKSKLSKLGDEDNFWSMGDTGPCGPCSEIFYDYGSDYDGSPPGEGDTGDRFVEIWNLVFMEFNRDSSGDLKPLPNKCVDTGMGLERVCSVLQNVGSNFEIDLFKSFKNDIRGSFDSPNEQSLNVIADHLRASFFLLSEQVHPSNEGRGYVLRRLIRRAIRHGYKMGKENPFLYELLENLKSLLKKDFPKEFKDYKSIKEILMREEELFFKTLSSGIKIFEDNLPTKESEMMSGDIAFKLHDTYGFPIDLTIAMASERGIDVDEKTFKDLMKKQKEGSKRSSMFNAKDIVIAPGMDSEFVGYEKNKINGDCVALFDSEGNEAKTLTDSGYAFFSKTPFYAESGGQVGDQGSISNDNLEIFVSDCKKVGNFNMHKVEIQKGEISVGDKVSLSINEERRKKIINNHSATHLLHSALREVLGDGVQQKGSLVNDEKLRFDFSHGKKLTSEQIEQVEDLVNMRIEDAIDTKIEEKSFDDAIKDGALAFFGDKYGDKVRVLTIGGDFSVELCGGTHVKNTSEIEGFIISNETSVSAGVRRVEAMTGSNLVKKSKEAIQTLKELSEILNVPSEDLVERVSEVIKENKNLKSKKKTEKSLSAEIVHEVKLNFNEGEGIVIFYKNASIEMLRRFSDKAKDEEGIFSIFMTDDGEKVSYIVTSKTNDNFSSKNIIDLVNSSFDGSGGGRDDFAQGGSQNNSNISDKFENLKSKLEDLA